MPQTNHGSIEFLKFPNPQHPGDTSQMIKKWLRDSWARRKIAALQQAIAGIVVPTASTENPAMDGTASAGSSTAWARGDHVHPSDTAKQDALSTAQLNAITDISATSTYTLTRTNNSFVNATDFARIYVYKVAPKLAIMVCNLKLSAQFTASDFVQIGTISGISLVRNHIQGINGQNAVGNCLMLQTSTTGAISIYSLGSATGEWFRAIIPLVLS